MPISVARRIIFVGIAVCGAVGVLMQFLQQEDPRMPLWYFTVDAAILSSVFASIAATRAKIVYAKVTAWLFTASIVSGIVYWSVIYPFNGIGQNLEMVLANILLHAILPVLILVSQLSLCSLPRETRMLSSLSVPVIYLVAVIGSSRVLHQEVPYAFLDISIIGLQMFLLAMAGIGLITCGTFWLVCRLQSSLCC
ncbi:MAG: hypothetical protein QM705_00905 [Ancrocorticia sp.]